MKGTPASLAKPVARKAAAMIPCNVQAPMRRVGRTDWMEAALMLVSVGCEVESEEKLRRRLPWQKPIYSDDIHRPRRYVADGRKAELWMFCKRMRSRDPPVTRCCNVAHACSDVIRLRRRDGSSNLERWRSEFDRDARICRRFECAHLLPIEACAGLPPARQEIGSGTSLQEGDFSAPDTTSRRGLGGRPARRSTSPVTISNAPAAKLAWTLTTMLTAPTGKPAFLSPTRSCSSVMTRNASGRPVISAMRPARSA